MGRRFWQLQGATIVEYRRTGQLPAAALRLFYFPLGFSEHHAVSATSGSGQSIRR